MSSYYIGRVFSAYVKEIEEKPGSTCWGKKMTFGACMAEFSNGGGRLTLYPPPYPLSLIFRLRGRGLCMMLPVELQYKM